MKKKVMALLALSISFAVASAWAHTYDETNDVVYAALSRASSYYDDLLEGSPPDKDPPPTTWRGFLGADTNGWTLAGKMAAFDWYLSTLATNDCETLDDFDELYARVAIGKCEEFNYTNSVNAMKALSLNPKGVERQQAIRLMIKFSPVDDFMTAFTETIMTNSIGYSVRERSAASCQYASRLLSFNATNESQQTILDNAVEMFYRNRMLSPNAVTIVDGLFVRYIGNYAMSSNRLEHALNALAFPDCGSVTKRRFTSVTNQLLSSGQPLPWINVGGGGN